MKIIKGRDMHMASRISYELGAEEIKAENKITNACTKWRACFFGTT